MKGRVCSSPAQGFSPASFQKDAANEMTVRFLGLILIRGTHPSLPPSLPSTCSALVAAVGLLPQARPPFQNRRQGDRSVLGQIQTQHGGGWWREGRKGREGGRRRQGQRPRDVVGDHPRARGQGEQG